APNGWRRGPSEFHRLGFRPSYSSGKGLDGDSSPSPSSAHRRSEPPGECVRFLGVFRLLRPTEDLGELLRRLRIAFKDILVFFCRFLVEALLRRLPEE